MVMVEHNTPSRKILFLWIQGVSPDCGNVENYLCVVLNPHHDAEVPISARVASLWRTLWVDHNDVITTSSYALRWRSLDVVLSLWLRPIRCSRSEERRVGKECRCRWQTER